MRNILTTLICIVLSIQISIAQQNIAVSDSTVMLTEIKKENTSSDNKTGFVVACVIVAVAAPIVAHFAFAFGNVVGNKGPKIVKNIVEIGL